MVGLNTSGSAAVSAEFESALMSALQKDDPLRESGNRLRLWLLNEARLEGWHSGLLQKTTVTLSKSAFGSAKSSAVVSNTGAVRSSDLKQGDIGSGELRLESDGAPHAGIAEPAETDLSFTRGLTEAFLVKEAFLCTFEFVRERLGGEL